MEQVPRAGRDLGADAGRTADRGATGLVFNVQRFAIHDGPGVRTVVFLKGCPLACAWCHNPESRSGRPELSIRAERCIQCGTCRDACPHDAVVRRADGTFSADPGHCSACGACTEACPTGGREIIGVESTVDGVLEEAEKDRVFYEESGGGVTFSGGEPMAQPAFLLALLEACRARGLHSAVDTCGMAHEQTIRAVAERTDLFLFDLKVMDESRHVRLTGVSNRPILRNLELLGAIDADVWIRFPLIPGVNDDHENLDALSAFVGSLGKDYPIHVLPYHPLARDKHGRRGEQYPLGDVTPPSADETIAVTRRLEAPRRRVRIGG